MKRFFECLVPVTACNLKCEYCYVRQSGRNQNQIVPFKYSAEQIASAFTKENLGGICFVSLTGAGETLFHPELPSLVCGLLKNGHYVNITTNGTYTKGLNQILDMLPPEYAERLLFSFSLHWIELGKKKWLDVFADNVHKVKNFGCSILVQFNLYDGYIPYLNEIKEYCINNFGAMPQVAATRYEGPLALHTQLSEKEYTSYGKQFNSPLFEFTMQNFNVPRTEFCYAGAWSYKMYLERGTIKPCYCNGEEIDIYDAISCSFNYAPIGKNCHNRYCVNSSHFMSLGIVPSMYPNITYVGLRNRVEAKWFTPQMSNFLSHKLSDDNQQLSISAMTEYNVKWYCRKSLAKIKKMCKKILRR